MSLILLEQLFHKSLLSPEQQAELRKWFQGASDGQIKEALEILSRHPAWIPKLYKNVQQKGKILATQDAAAWQALLADEFSEITSQDS